MQDKLIEVLNKIAENPNPNKMVLLKKAIVQFFQNRDMDKQKL